MGSSCRLFGRISIDLVLLHQFGSTMDTSSNQTSRDLKALADRARIHSISIAILRYIHKNNINYKKNTHTQKKKKKYFETKEKSIPNQTIHAIEQSPARKHPLRKAAGKE